MTIILKQTDYNNALNLATTSYQKALITGEHTLSGSSIPIDKSGRWGHNWDQNFNYVNERDKLLKILRKSNISWCQIYGKNNKRMFVFGASGTISCEMFDFSENNFTNIQEISEYPFVLFIRDLDKLKTLPDGIARGVNIHKCLFLFENPTDAMLIKLMLL